MICILHPPQRLLRILAGEIKTFYFFILITPTGKRQTSCLLTSVTKELHLGLLRTNLANGYCGD